MLNYVCSFCEREFSHRSSLRNHVKIHDNVVNKILQEISEEIEQETNTWKKEEEELSDSEQLQEEEKEELREEKEELSNNEQLQGEEKEELNYNEQLGRKEEEEEEEEELNYNEQLGREEEEELNYNEQPGEAAIKEEVIDNDKIKYLLLYVELIQTFESIDISSLTIYKPEFPSEEFGDFIELLTRWNLSDTCSSDILKFVRKICYDDIILSLSVI
ncbi:6340_t:CDS:2 [Funneliformis mosseae]|uniref:6340_t:CDS:1 n=1 Tax=Funneliformis mosseae TaxID=27381 RepID=A0A9N9DYH4_FUNMO|nr:6340_t:CDS:2 [Funneliformis mosseae]